MAKKTEEEKIADLRDKAAMRALEGIVRGQPTPPDRKQALQVAQWAFLYADAMVAVRDS